jgi:Na+-translocating ferredoxin:NAD+ oxidoreductase RnfA subunit
MAWAALFLPFIIIVLLASGLVSSDKVTLVMSLATTFSASMGTVVVAFMAATAYVRGKMTDVPKPTLPPATPVRPPPPMPRATQEPPQL